MTFKTKEIHAATIGERLQRMRRERHLELSDIARTLGVRVRYLEALERGLFINLPPRVYAQGLARKYARLLGLPEEEIMAQFIAEYEASAAEKDISFRVPPPFLHRQRFAVTPKRLTIFFGVSVLVVIGVYFGYQIQQFIGKPELIVTRPAHDMFTDAEILAIQGRAGRNTKVTINGKEVMLAPDMTFAAEVKLKDGLNTIEIVSSTRLGKNTKVVRRIIKHAP